MLLKFSMKASALSLSSGEKGTEVAARVGAGFGAEVAVGVGWRSGAAVAAGVGKGMFVTAVEPGSGPEAAVGAEVEDGDAVLETVVGSSTAFRVAEGASRCTCRCCGSALGCEQAVAPIANITRA